MGTASRCFWRQLMVAIPYLLGGIAAFKVFGVAHYIAGELGIASGVWRVVLVDAIAAA